MMRQKSDSLILRQNRAGLHEFTDRVRSWVAGTAIGQGLLTLFCRRTSAALLIQLNIPVADGRMVLGTWQGIFLFEHRRSPRERLIALHLIGQ